MKSNASKQARRIKAELGSSKAGAKTSPTRTRGGGGATADEVNALRETVNFLKEMMEKTRKQIGIPEVRVSKSSDSDEEEEPPQLVQYDVYKKTISEIRKNIKDIRERIFEVETGGKDEDGSDSAPNQNSR